MGWKLTELAVVSGPADGLLGAAGSAKRRARRTGARKLQCAVSTLVGKPSDAAMKAAREAWLAARVPYQQTEVYRLGNTVVDAREGRVNAWPLDEGLIDYVDATKCGLANYCGSIAASSDGTLLCTTSPRGGLAIVFTPDGRVLDRVALPDACGVAATPGGFLPTGGRGDVVDSAASARAATRTRWDNHAVGLLAFTAE